jgi:amidase
LVTRTPSDGSPGSWWDRVFWSAIRRLCRPAAVRSAAEALSRGQPWLTRRWLVSWSTRRSRFARAVDRVRKADRGPLHGVPIAVKEELDVAGEVTTYGGEANSTPAAEDSEVIRRLREAGAVVVGKTTMPEFGAFPYTESASRGLTRNPWDRTRSPGGSSGGTAAAVASGMVPVGMGGDGGGSIRIPAACCGIVGLKPTRGRISGFPMYGDPIGLATAGTLARTVADAAALLDVLAGRRQGDPSWAPEPEGSFLAAVGREPGRLRIGAFIEPVIAEAEVHPEVRAGYEATTRLLAELGHVVEDVPVPLPMAAVPVFETCWAVLTALSVVPLAPARRDQLRPLTRWLSERGEAVSGPEFGLAVGQLRRYAAEALVALAPYDAILTPTLAQPPLAVGAIRDDADPAADFEAQKRFTPWTSAWNVTGMPALSLPLHQTADGLPVAMMLAGRPAEEELLLSLAGQIEAATDSRPGPVGSSRSAPGWLPR